MTDTTTDARFVLINGRIHRGTCKRRGTYKGGDLRIADTADLASVFPAATCCKPEKTAEWKAAAEDLVIRTAADRARLDAKLEQAIADPGTITPETPFGTTRLTLVAPDADLEGERTDTTERRVVVRHEGVAYVLRYVSRTYKPGASKPYGGKWVLEANGALIEGENGAYSVNGIRVGKVLLGTAAAVAATQTPM